MAEWTKRIVYQTELRSDILTNDELHAVVLESLNPHAKSEVILKEGIKIRIEKKYGSVVLTADVTESILPYDDAKRIIDEILAKIEKDIKFTESVKRSLKVLGLIGGDHESRK